MLHDIFMSNTWFFWFLWILIIAVIFIVIWINTREKNKYIPFDQNGEATDILRKRYASGEINKKQYEEMKKDIE